MVDYAPNQNGFSHFCFIFCIRARNERVESKQNKTTENAFESLIIVIVVRSPVFVIDFPFSSVHLFVALRFR